MKHSHRQTWIKWDYKEKKPQDLGPSLKNAGALNGHGTQLCPVLLALTYIQNNV